MTTRRLPSGLRMKFCPGTLRIAKGMVAFVATPGAATLIELTHKITVHAPAHWDTQRIVVSVADPGGFASAIAEARRGAPEA